MFDLPTKCCFYSRGALSCSCAPCIYLFIESSPDRGRCARNDFSTCKFYRQHARGRFRVRARSFFCSRVWRAVNVFDSVPENASTKAARCQACGAESTRSRAARRQKYVTLPLIRGRADAVTNAQAAVSLRCGYGGLVARAARRARTRVPPMPGRAPPTSRATSSSDIPGSPVRHHQVRRDA